MRNFLRFPCVAILAAISTVSTVSASSLATSYTGTFTNDNEVVQLPFIVTSLSRVAFQSFGFGGGVNAASNVIAPGGFESLLQFFTVPDGSFDGSIFPGPDPECGRRTPDPSRLNFCFDVFGERYLGAGSYLVVLTQSPNVTAGTNLSDGFVYDGDPTFNSGFFGTFGLPGDGHWALDITIDEVPEPGSVTLVASALLLAGIRLRRRAN